MELVGWRRRRRKEEGEDGGCKVMVDVGTCRLSYAPPRLSYYVMLFALSYSQIKEKCGMLCYVLFVINLRVFGIVR